MNTPEFLITVLMVVMNAIIGIPVLSEIRERLVTEKQFSGSFTKWFFIVHGTTAFLAMVALIMIPLMFGLTSGAISILFVIALRIFLDEQL